MVVAYFYFLLFTFYFHKPPTLKGATKLQVVRQVLFENFSESSKSTLEYSKYSRQIFFIFFCLETKEPKIQDSIKKPKNE